MAIYKCHSQKQATPLKYAHSRNESLWAWFVISPSSNYIAEDVRLRTSQKEDVASMSTKKDIHADNTILLIHVAIKAHSMLYNIWDLKKRHSISLLVFYKLKAISPNNQGKSYYIHLAPGSRQKWWSQGQNQPTCLHWTGVNKHTFPEAVTC